jgi:ATP-dependent Zn protease
VDHTSRISQTEIRWQKIVLTLITIILLLGLLYFLIRSHSQKLRCATTTTQDTEGVTSPQTLPQQTRTPEPRPRDTEHNVVFSRYSATAREYRTAH